MSISIFTDSSVNPQMKIGVGAYLIIEDSDLIEVDKIKLKIRTKKFDNVSSTKSEVQTALLALSEYQQQFDSQKDITLYTDSQCITGLLARRVRLESNYYKSKAGKLLSNSDEYKLFYELYDIISFDIYKVKGHLKKSKRNDIQDVFSLVDRAARKSLKEWVIAINS